MPFKKGQELKRRLMPFWTAEVYGLGVQIRKYGYYPRCLPLCIDTDHGIKFVRLPVEDGIGFHSTMYSFS